VTVVSVLREICSVYPHAPYLFKTHFDIIFKRTAVNSKWPLPFISVCSMSDEGHSSKLLKAEW